MTESGKFPRVLILGETFRNNGGGGITLINLFKNWHINSLAVATEKIIETNGGGCTKFYRLGHLEMQFPFPFNHINKVDGSGEVGFSDLNPATTSVGIAAERSLLSKIKFEFEKAYYVVLKRAGIINSNYMLRTSENLITWIKEFNPDVIYAQPFNYRDMVFTLQVIRATGIPLAVHIMDDSVSFSNKPNLLYFFWKKKIQNTFAHLVKVAKIHLSISDAMSAEYLRRYNKKFVPFRNPIDLDAWLPYIKTDWSMKDEVKIIYTGRLAEPNIHALKQFCKAVERVRNSGIPVKLHIFSIDYVPGVEIQVGQYQSVEFHKAVPFKEIPALLTQYDIALLPFDFNKKGRKYAKYSISTKTSEYMISGVPIFLYAPEDIAITKYATDHECMFVNSSDNPDDLVNDLKLLATNENLRSRLAKKSIAVAKNDSDSSSVRRQFLEALKMESDFEMEKAGSQVHETRQDNIQ